MTAPLLYGIRSPSLRIDIAGLDREYVFTHSRHRNMKNSIFCLVDPVYGMDTYIAKVNVFFERC